MDPAASAIVAAAKVRLDGTLAILARTFRAAT